MATAMDGHDEVLGSASALLGMAQFGVGAALAPLVGLAGSHSAIPMAIVMAVCGSGRCSSNWPRGVPRSSEPEPAVDRDRRARQMLSPPSTATVAPVMNELSSLARNSTAAAISAGAAWRASGII